MMGLAMMQLPDHSHWFPAIDEALRRGLQAILHQPIPRATARTHGEIAERAAADPVAMAGNIAAGKVGEPELAWLQKGFSVWLDNRGAIKLERCLRLPGSSRKLVSADRDRHLRLAWNLIDAPSPWLKSVGLSKEINAFMSRVWPAWKRLSDPPQGCSELRGAIFKAMRSGARLPSTVQQVHNICAADK